jgi:hypothetical protein
MAHVIATELPPKLPPFLHPGQVQRTQQLTGLCRRPMYLDRGMDQAEPVPPICLSSDHLPMVEELRADMKADTLTDALFKCVKFTRWVLGLQRQGYKLAMVKDAQVQAIQVF